MNEIWGIVAAASAGVSTFISIAVLLRTSSREHIEEKIDASLNHFATRMENVFMRKDIAELKFAHLDHRLTRNSDLQSELIRSELDRRKAEEASNE